MKEGMDTHGTGYYEVVHRIQEEEEQEQDIEGLCANLIDLYYDKKYADYWQYRSSYMDFTHIY